MQTIANLRFKSPKMLSKQIGLASSTIGCNCADNRRRFHIKYLIDPKNTVSSCSATHTGPIHQLALFSPLTTSYSN